MPKAKRAKPRLPDWAKEGYKPPYGEKVHTVDVRPKVIKGKNKSPFKIQTRISSGTGAGSYPTNK